MTDPNKPFVPSTDHLDAAGPPPATPETAVQPLSPETEAAFNARAEEAAIQADVRAKFATLFAGLGEAAARKILGL